MESILHIGLHKETLTLLQENIEVANLTFEEASGESFKQTCKTLQHHRALLIGEEVANPIRFAQDAYAHDKCISILLVNDSANNEKIKQALQFSPFVGPTVQCVSNAIGQRMSPILEDAMQRTIQRRSFAKLKSTSMMEQRFAPNALEKVRADFTTKILEEAPIGAILVSGTGTVFSINNYALVLLTKTEKEVLGTSVNDLFPEELQEEIMQFLLDGYISEPKRVFEVKRAEDSLFLELSVAPIDTRASSNYKLVILNNITPMVVAQQHTQAHLEELERLNTNLARVNADLDTFVYTASHDLKSPILNIEGLVTSLEEELGPARGAVETELEHIKRSIKRFKQTVEGLTEVSRIQKNFEQKASLINIQELLEEVRQLLEQEIEASEALIELAADANHIILFSKRNLTSILYNLIGNAIKYRSPVRKPFICISTWCESGDYCLSVSDNGLGIPSANQKRVFQLFKRMHSHVEGSGVGLYIVNRIVEINGGQITVESKEGIGSTFTIRLKQIGTPVIGSST